MVMAGGAHGGLGPQGSNMRILHVITGMRKAAGTTVFVENVMAGLRERGHDVEMTTVADPRAVDGFDLVHIHGLWEPFLHSAAKRARKLGIPIVWSPHGMLQKWALKNGWWKKFVALALYQWRDLRSAVILHATAQSEVDDIRRLKLKNKIVVAPLGVRIPDGDVGLGRRSTAEGKTLLFVSRVQRKKGLPNLIEAWSRLPQDLRRTWQVRIVGPDQDNHVAELKVQCEHLGLTYSDDANSTVGLGLRPRPDFIFVGPKYDADLDTEYDNADLFVLPTHSENFGSVVIEALAHGMPVVTTKEAPWAELENFKCGWWIDDNVNALTAALCEACGVEGFRVLREKGGRGRKLVEERYTWAAVCDQIVEAYESVVHRGRT